MSTIYCICNLFFTFCLIRLIKICYFAQNLQKGNIYVIIKTVVKVKMRVKIFEKPLIYAEFFSFKLTKKQQHEISHKLLDDMLYENYGIKNPKFEYGEYGKPFLAEYKNIFFSISHCNKAVCVAISEKNIGTDIEIIRKYSESVVRRVFTEKEASELEKTAEKDKFFFQIWTLKESIIKFDGRGISYGMKNIEINLKNKEINPYFNFGQKILSDSFVISYVQ